MGCSNSKLHSLPAVSLCRDRCKFLAEALHHIHSLSAAHVAYLQSLESLGSSLHRFLDQQNSIPRRRPSEDLKPPPAAASAILTGRSSSSLSSKSNPNSHLHFVDSESENENASKVSSNLNRSEEPHYNFYEYCVAFPDGEMGGNRLFYPRSTAPSPPPAAAGDLGWDILNLFDAYDRCQLHLESEKDKLLDGEIPLSIEPPAVDDEKKNGEKKEDPEESKSKKDSSENKDNLATKEPDTTGSGTSRVAVDEIGREMQSLFGEASVSGRRVLELLDVAKIRYLHNHGVTKEPETMPSSISVAVSVGEEVDGGGGGGDLSSTLTKLSTWEKKLYHEVKAEGKLRILYAQKWKELKQLGSSKNDAEAKKVESIRNLVVTLSAKLKISFHVIDKVSMTLNSLRDQELWPWIDQLIHGFQEMWKTMLKCHGSQHKLVEDFVKTLDGDAIQPEWDSVEGDRHLEEAMRLRSDLHSWSLSFCNWIHTQKRFAKALDGWLLRCITHEPEGESAADSSIDAPSVFVVSNQWSKALETVSDKEVTEAANGFLRALEQHSVELMLQRAIADSKEQIKMEKKRFSLARFGANNNNGSGFGLASCGRNAVRSEFCDATNVTVQCCLKCTFEAMEKFGATSTKIYEELCGQAERCQDPQEIYN